MESETIKQPLTPDLIFTPEEPPIPTAILATDLDNTSALLVQKGVKDKPVYSTVTIDHEWIPTVLSGENEAVRAMNHMVLIPTPLDERIVFSSQAEAIATIYDRYVASREPMPESYFTYEQMKAYAISCGIDVDSIEAEWERKEAEENERIIPAEFVPLSNE